MSGLKGWETGLPKLPEGFVFRIRAIPAGTWIFVDQIGPSPSFQPMPIFVDSEGHEPQATYLTKIWNTANHISNQLLDAEERQSWIEAAFE